MIFISVKGYLPYVEFLILSILGVSFGTILVDLGGVRLPTRKLFQRYQVPESRWAKIKKLCKVDRLRKPHKNDCK